MKTQALYDDEVNPGHRETITSTASNGIYENVSTQDEEGDETALQSLERAKKMMQGLLRKIDNTIAIANIKQCQVFTNNIFTLNPDYAREKKGFFKFCLIKF